MRNSIQGDSSYFFGLASHLLKFHSIKVLGYYGIINWKRHKMEWQWSNLSSSTGRDEGTEEENKNRQFCVTFGFQYKIILSLHQG